MDENPYQAPNSPLVLESNELVLASRGARFGGALLDYLIEAAILVPLEYVTGYMQTVMDASRVHQMPPFSQVVLWGAIWLAIFVVVQGYPLVKDGQTWGKKLVNTRIVTTDGRIPSVSQLCLRYLVVRLLSLVPYVRMVVWAEVLLVFRADKRCGHDLIAGTQVVEAYGKRST